MTGPIGAALLLAVLGTAGPVWAAPPAPTKIFACALADTKPTAPSTKTPWTTRAWAELELAVSLPQSLKVARVSPQRVDVASRRWNLSLRRSKRVPAGGISAAKAALERYELRPSHISRRCERAALGRLLPPASTAFRRARLGVHSRPLGQRRRTFALYLEHVDSTVVTALLTVTWPRGRSGPNLRGVARLLASVAAARPHLARATPAAAE